MARGDTSLGGGGMAFPQTTWGLVSQLQKRREERQAALEKLCSTYWRPIYAYVRRGWGKSNEDAKDLTQAFFLWLMDGEALQGYDRSISNFRFFLKGLLRNFVRNSDQALRRLKRGGDVQHLPLQTELRDLADVLADADAESPEEAFDRAWTDELLERATERAQTRWATEGPTVRLQVFTAYELAPAGVQPTYASVAETLGVKVSDVRNHLYAARETIRAELRAELRETVSSPAQLEEEWQALFC